MKILVLYRFSEIDNDLDYNYTDTDSDSQMSSF